MSSKNLLVLGSGGREHAITWALTRSPQAGEIYVAPGNAGTAEIATNVADLNITNGDDLVHFCEAHAIDLVVIGPEAPLVDGMADALRAAGYKVFGPDAVDAQLEGSKAFSKAFMLAMGIPTADYDSFDTEEQALDYLKTHHAPIVIKADGLAAGKGVVVAETDEAAEEAVKACFSGSFGNAGYKVVIEECMTGPECSLLAFVAGGQALPMELAQDHKRALEGDRGPNTGGMGAYSPVPVVTSSEHDEMIQIMQRAASGLIGNQEVPGTSDIAPLDYRGVLYGGFMLTPEGPKIVEFNVRFGDPETQAVLPRLKSDLLEVMEKVSLGILEGVELEWDPRFAVCVVLCSEGYPGSYEKGKVILGVEEAQALDDVLVFHAGTARNADGELVTAGGRVLNVVALGDSFEEARDRVYKACDLINFEGKQYRGDIGKKAMEQA